MRFDTYNIAEEALRNEIAPESIADTIFVSRAFTPYQILDALYSLLESGRPLGNGCNEVHFILAPSKQFFDGDVAFDEGLYLLEQLVEVVKKIHKKKIPLAIVEHQNYAHPVFQSVFPQMVALAEPVFVLKKTTDQEVYTLHLSKVRNSVNLQGTGLKFLREAGNHGQNSFGLFDGNREGTQSLQKLSQGIA